MARKPTQDTPNPKAAHYVDVIESALLSAVLNDPQEWSKAAALAPVDFGRFTRQTIFRAMRESAPDMANVENWLRQHNQYDDVASELLNVFNDPAGYGGINPDWILQIKVAALRRLLWHESEHLATLSISTHLDVVEEAYQMASRLAKLADAAVTSVTTPESPEEAQARLEQLIPGIQTLDELLAEELPPTREIVPGIIYEGLTLLAAKPKIGKSWLALCLCLAVAYGGRALGSILCEQGDVLYISLEDSKKRLQKRTRQLIQEMGNHKTGSRFTYHTRWPRINEGGLDAITLWIHAHPEARLIVIDTLAKIKPRTTGKRTQYDEDYSALEPLQQLAIETGVAILVIHHTSKASQADPLDEVSGTLGLNGSSDNILVLRRERGKADATLIGDGREVQGLEKALRISGLGTWTIAGEASDFAKTPERTEVLQALKKKAAEGFVCTIQDVVEMTSKEYDVVKNLLSKMARDEEIKSAGRGLYTTLEYQPVTSVTSVTLDTLETSDTSAGQAGSNDVTNVTPFIVGSDTCTVCGVEADHYGPDGQPYCAAHQP